MDASIVLTTPQAPPPSAAESSSSDVSREDAEAFAAHLSQEEEARPAARKPAAVTKDEPADEDDKTVASTPAPSFSLTSPIAPVLVRADGAPAVLDIALTPAPSATPQQPPLDAGLVAPLVAAPINGAPSKDTLAPAAAGATQTPSPASPVAAPQATAAPEPSATPAAATNDTAPDIAAQVTLPTAATLAAAAATPAKATPSEPVTESLRNAGKPRGAKAEALASGEAKPVSAAPATAQAGARANANPDFLAASVSATAAATTPQTDGDATAQPTTSGEAAAVSLEARRAAEAPPVAVHRPPTLAATVAQHIIRRFDGKSTTIDVRLDPAELGRVSVKLEVGADSRVTAVVAADNPATLSDLMRSSRELERALESAGLELTQGGLSFDLSDRSSGNSAHAQDANAPGGRAGNDNAVVSADAVAPTSRPFGLESWRGVRVDVTV